MRVRIFALFLLTSIVSCGSPSSNPNFNIAQVQGDQLEELIYDASPSGEQRLRVKPNIQTRDDLYAYREFKISQAREILQATRMQSNDRPYYPVVVTMSHPLSLQDFNKLIRSYNPTTISEVTKLLDQHAKAMPKTEIIKGIDALVIEQVKFVSTTGRGQLSYESLTDQAGLAALEAKLAAKEMQYNGVTDYQLVRGVTSISGGVHRDRLLGLEDEPGVFLADIGPKELYDGTVSAAVWSDIYDEVESFANQ